MRTIHHIVIFVLCCWFAGGNLSAQSQDMSGRDFWVITGHSSLSNWETISGIQPFDSVILYIVGDTATTGSVDNEHYGFHLDFQVIPEQVTLLRIPLSMVMFDHLNSSDNWTIRTSYRGIRVRSSRNVYVYMQDLCCVADSSGYWYGNCSPYLSPIMENTVCSEKNPVPPLSYQERVLFPDSFEDWWFDRCDTLYGFGAGSSACGFHSIRYVTALEDSTVVTFSYYETPTASTQLIDSVILHKDETVFIVNRNSVNPPHMEHLKQIKTNCKPVSTMFAYRAQGYGHDNSFFHGFYNLGSYHPFTNSHIHQGCDYLCKKLENNRFDKGIFYLKLQVCLNPLIPMWSENADRYMYNELVTGSEFAMNFASITNLPNSYSAIRAYTPTTGNHRGYWGSISSYVNVPYTFLRSPSPIIFNEMNGPYYFVCKDSRPVQPIYGIQYDTIGCSRVLQVPPFVSAQPTDRMVKDWVYPTTRNNIKRKIHYDDVETLNIDTLYADVQIYVHENGLNTTYFNGQLLPAEVFDSFPMTNGDYYVTQMAFYNEDIPEIIRISNVNGFSAYVDEFGYNVLPAPPNHPEIDDITKVYYYHAGASGCFYTDYPSGSINIAEHNFDTVHRCLGDTLALLVEHNPDSVPVEWIVDGVSHLGDGYSFLLAALDTISVQCVLHYECPDTTTTFVAVVPPPVLTIAHDTTVCAGATLSVEQPNVLSYLWSNGATTPAITVDSAGMFQVAVTNIGCRAESDSFHVSLYGQSSVDFGSDSLLCELATLLLDATQQHPAQYFWQDASTNTTYTVYEDGEYWVIITDNCLGASDTINIGYLNDFTVNLGPDTLLCEGRTMTLNAEVPYCDYLWQDGSTQPTYVVRGPGTYSVEVSNRCFSHWDAVDVDYEHCAQELYLPNAFTPNGDGENPVFLPVFSYPDEIEEYRMEIYNRWGTLVFRTEEKTYGWDGANAINGVYAVVVYYKTRGEKEKTVKGSVTVVR